ncbi:hypothetical protein [Rhodococcus sp. JS3073]|uniref:hypothetical protein n=1 Tax=Rhodococcus sp. JS3073 TaxID=3002901 RepID=UPI002285585E|nr:hypothetical protein [Rhodococcus sp. JS3073]WAM17512.1 hypothetical protein OYT95_13105 [Rhodococcus sp. JS3073]
MKQLRTSKTSTRTTSTTEQTTVETLDYSLTEIEALLDTANAQYGTGAHTAALSALTLAVVGLTAELRANREAQK